MTNMVNEPYWIKDVLHFWFDELGEADWFSGDAGLDHQIRMRFLALHLQLVATDAAGIQEPRALLAAVIVFDQFSRNLFRNDPRVAQRRMDPLCVAAPAAHRAVWTLSGAQCRVGTAGHA